MRRKYLIKIFFVLLIVVIIIHFITKLILHVSLIEFYLFQAKNIIYRYSCVPEGKEGNYFNHQKCCIGLTEIGIGSPLEKPLDKFEGITMPCPILANGGFICAKCGNGVCGSGENNCNCPQDCR